MMILQYVQHVPFEGLGSIESWAATRGHEVRLTRAHAGEVMPRANEFDLLVVLGGPMNVYQEREYPFLSAEKRLIENSVREGKPVLGICLGAQLIADVLGAKVYRNTEEEIGWFPVELTAAQNLKPSLSTQPGPLVTFHWHGDTFELPGGAARFASSEACANQAFVYGDGVVGLQFHPEVTEDWVRLMLRHEGHGVRGGPYVQPPEEMLSPHRPYRENEAFLTNILDALVASRRSTPS